MCAKVIAYTCCKTEINMKTVDCNEAVCFCFMSTAYAAFAEFIFTMYQSASMADWWTFGCAVIATMDDVLR